MIVWYTALIGIGFIGIIVIMQWAVNRYWNLPFRQPTVYYTKLHKFLHFGLTGAFLLSHVSISFAVANGEIGSDFRLFIVPFLLIGLTEPLKIYMEWKYAENRILYKANLVTLLVGTALAVLMIFVYIQFLEVPFL